jgi:hypothetical protein
MLLKFAPVKRTSCKMSPICAQIACMSWMSKPVAIPFSLNSKGGSGMAEATVRMQCGAHFAFSRARPYRGLILLVRGKEGWVVLHSLRRTAMGSVEAAR